MAVKDSKAGSREKKKEENTMPKSNTINNTSNNNPRPTKQTTSTPRAKAPSKPKPQDKPKEEIPANVEKVEGRSNPKDNTPKKRPSTPRSKTGSKPDKKIDTNAPQKKSADPNQKSSGDAESTSADTQSSPKKKPGAKPGGNREQQPRRNNNQAKLQWEDMLQIAELYDAGESTDEIAKQYSVARSYIYYVLNRPDIKKIRLAKSDAATEALAQTFALNAAKIDNLITTYLDEALNPLRIASTKLPGLFTVLGVTLDKVLKVQELELKKQELAIRKEEAGKAAQANVGLLSDFMQVIQQANTLPQREEDKPQSDESEQLSIEGMEKPEE